MKDGAKAQDSGCRIAKLERILEKERKEFEVFSTNRLLATFSFFTGWFIVCISWEQQCSRKFDPFGLCYGFE